MRMCVRKTRKTLQIRQFCIGKHRVSEFFRLARARSGTSLRHVLKRVQIVAKSVGNHFYKIVYVRNAFVFFHNVPVVK